MQLIAHDIESKTGYHNIFDWKDDSMSSIATRIAHKNIPSFMINSTK